MKSKKYARVYLHASGFLMRSSNHLQIFAASQQICLLHYLLNRKVSNECNNNMKGIKSVITLWRECTNKRKNEAVSAIRNN